MKIHRGAHSTCLTVLLFAVGLPRVAPGQLLGPEFQVNSYTTSDQWLPAVAADSSGNFIVAWSSSGQDGSLQGVFGQLFDSAGTAVGSEFRVNTYTLAGQRNPRAAMDSQGNFVVAWFSDAQDGSSWGVFGQRFSSTGSPMGGEFQVNTFTTSHQQYPEVAADGSGNFVVVWASSQQDGSDFGVFGQRLDSTGSPVGNEFQVNTFTTAFQVDAAVAADSAGNFVVVWESSGQDGSGSGVFGQRFSSAGIGVGGEFQVNTYTTSHQWAPAVATDGSGNFVVTWQSDGQDGSMNGIFGQRFNAAGAPAGGEFQINSHTTGSQQFSRVAADGAGNFFVGWESDGQDGSNWGVFGQRFNFAGSRIEAEIQLNTHTANNQTGPTVAADASGNFMVGWSSWGGVGQDGSGGGAFGKRMVVEVFNGTAATFEDGSACGWDVVIGSGETCP